MAGQCPMPKSAVCIPGGGPFMSARIDRNGAPAHPVEKSLGRGTRSCILGHVGAPPSADGGPTRGRVLVIDDEPAIGRVVGRSLSAEHDVTSVTRARDALARIGEGERFDVILCDLMMPELTGMDFFFELERSFPEQARRVIFLTGGAFTTTIADFVDKVANSRIDKPFDPHMLRRIVRERVAGGATA